ncbi:MAG: EAL domain-containing response regulator [Burkholderiales bacterium]|uniref:EAL domain-containing response regulator n=1 Tax=Candidatus Aalborgicola defluviihabitans TaxID=3386187 RepID=UPI001DCA3F5A|nr:EAL domain-containing response regulator [Burkholderiales bacterium]MBK6567559.1 EAL domain-containing response regulator [Burkholderiales bacterium]MBK7282399.1 EAL domain-containing response regulator [Burkholderiales bacterium]MBL0244910.1 EAL domain-containing response regulator [Rhodoferax sp.]
MAIARLNFLVVEDHDFQRKMLVRILHGIGANAIYEAKDGVGALAILQEPGKPVDIIISDLDMPGMDGMAFVRNLGESGVRVSIILASALDRNLLASIQTMAEAYGINLLGVLEKPLTPDKLLPIIARHSILASQLPHRTSPVFTLEEILAGLRDGEFEPYYQPKIEMATRRVSGAESLARWNHRQYGLVAPCDFIPTLELQGKIGTLTETMVEKTAAFRRTWAAHGIDGSVSINLSIRSLVDVRTADHVIELVRAHHVEPRDVVVEVTESALTTDVGHTLENLARLRMKGFGLSIDDYGTGYSSMQQLIRIAFTELKIDQSFVANASRQESARVILEASLGMARKLNICSVAEGVETQADWDMLRQLDCHTVQGYLIARPMPSEEYLDWVKDWNRSI